MSDGKATMWAMPEEAVIAARMAAGKYNLVIPNEAMTDILSAAMSHIYAVENAPAMTKETVRTDRTQEAVGMLNHNLNVVIRDLYGSGFWGRLRWIFRGATS